MLAVVSDSSPLVYLTRLGRFDLLRQLYEGVFIPMAVWREVGIEGAARPEGANVKLAVAAGWLKVDSAISTALSEDPAFLELGDGEREAIVLAQTKNALLIIDETEGRAVALRLGVRHTGTIGIRVEAKLRGLITHVRPELRRLRDESNFRFTDELFAAALVKAGETEV
ncbi:MAG: DUF3368 domain-containing protein [Pedosphaera sp.]|nr:DUF3368 domain-containing protein [Pedosphaera sp.]